MKILVFTKQFWPEGGGAELATYLIVKNILSKNFNVIVVSGTKNPQPSISKYCKYLHWPILKIKYKPIEWLILFANLKTIGKLIKKVDTVYIPSHTLLPLAVAVKYINPKVKVILHLHNYQPLTYTSVILVGKEPNLATDLIVELGEHHSLTRAIASGMLYPLNKVNLLALRYADRVICVSKKQLKILVKHIPWLKEKATVIYNPPPPISNIEKRLNYQPLILYMGGGSFVKGFYIAVKVMAETIYNSNIIFIVTYGRSTGQKQERLLYKLASRFPERLIINGYIPYDEIAKLYSRAWALLFPSIWEEPLPYAIVEASLVGTIPIAARIGGISELLQDSAARSFLFRPYDYNSLKSKIERLIAMDQREIIELGHDIRARVFSKLKTSTEKFLKIFRDLQT